MDQLLYWVEARGLNSTLHDIFFVGCSVVLGVFCLLNARNYRIPLRVFPFPAGIRAG